MSVVVAVGIVKTKYSTVVHLVDRVVYVGHLRCNVTNDVVASLIIAACDKHQAEWMDVAAEDTVNHRVGT